MIVHKVSGFVYTNPIKASLFRLLNKLGLKTAHYHDPEYYDSNQSVWVTRSSLSVPRYGKSGF